MSGVAIVFGAVLHVALSGLEADAIAQISTRARIRRKSKAVNDEAKQILMALSGCKSIPGAAPKAEMMADPWVKARDVNGVSEKDLYKFEFPELKGQANYTKCTQITMESVHVTKANAWSALDFRLVKLKAVEASMASYEADGAKRSVIEEAKTAVNQAKERCVWRPRLVGILLARRRSQMRSALIRRWMTALAASHLRRSRGRRARGRRRQRGRSRWSPRTHVLLMSSLRTG